MSAVVDLFRHHIVPAETLLSDAFPLCAWLAVIHIRIDGNAAAWQKFSPDFDVFWIEQTHEIVHDDIDAIFVEIAMIAEGEEIELEAFAFHETCIRHIGNGDRGKIRLAGDGQRLVNSGQLNLTK